MKSGSILQINAVVWTLHASYIMLLSGGNTVRLPHWSLSSSKVSSCFSNDTLLMFLLINLPFWWPNSDSVFFSLLWKNETLPENVTFQPGHSLRRNESEDIHCPPCLSSFPPLFCVIRCISSLVFGYRAKSTTEEGWKMRILQRGWAQNTLGVVFINSFLMHSEGLGRRKSSHLK